MVVSEQLHAPATMRSRERAPSAHCVGDWMHPRNYWGILVRKENLLLSGTEPNESIRFPE
jgi:hypothetical protein